MGKIYLSFTPDRVASADTIIKTFALNDSEQLTPANKSAILDFAEAAKHTLKFNPNAKIVVVTRPGPADQVFKRKAAVYQTLEKAGFPANKIDQKEVVDQVQFNDFVKAIDPRRNGVTSTLQSCFEIRGSDARSHFASARHA